MNCPICYEKITHGSSETTKCNHCFHASCLNTWLVSSHTCPMCRFELRERPQSPTGLLEYEYDEDEHEFFRPNSDLGQVLDYGELF